MKRQNRRRWTQAEINRAIKLRLSGWSVWRIARVLRRNGSSVGELELRLAPNDKQGVYAIVFENPGQWRAVMMGLDRNQSDPPGRRYIPGAGAVSHIQAPLLADWYQERGEEDHASHLRREWVGGAR